MQDLLSGKYVFRVTLRPDEAVFRDAVQAHEISAYFAACFRSEGIIRRLSRAAEFPNPVFAKRYARLSAARTEKARSPPSPPLPSLIRARRPLQARRSSFNRGPA